MLNRVTLRTSKRASSVPVEPYRSFDTNGVGTARRISNAALDDSDALMAASRRTDRQLLQDINNRLATQSMQVPPSAVIRRATTTSVRKPPLPPTGRSSTTTYSTVSTALPRRSAASRFADDDDIDLMPPTPVTKSIIRASSVPPRLPAVSLPLVSDRTTTYTANHVGPYVSYSPNPILLRGHHWTSSTDGINDENSIIQNNADLYGYVPTRITSPPSQITPVADLAIKQAHRNLDRIDKELGYNALNGPIVTGRYTPTELSYVEVPSSNHLAYRRPYYHRTPSTVGSGPASSMRIRHASLSPLRGSGGSTYHRIASSPRASSPIRPSELLYLASASSVPVVERELTSVRRVPKIITETQVISTPSYRPPVSSSYVAPVSSFSSTKSYPDLSLGSYAQPSIPRAGRSNVSEARQKVRDVLCKVKKDPHYFD